MCTDSTRWAEQPSSSQQQRVERRTLTLNVYPRHDLRHGMSRPPSTNSRTEVCTPRRARHTAGPYPGQGTCEIRRVHRQTRRQQRRWSRRWTSNHSTPKKPNSCDPTRTSEEIQAHDQTPCLGICFQVLPLEPENDPTLPVKKRATARTKCDRMCDALLARAQRLAKTMLLRRRSRTQGGMGVRNRVQCQEHTCSWTLT